MMGSDDSALVAVSPFHGRTALHCRTNRWSERAGVSLVDVYETLETDYWALDLAGLIDLTGLATLRIAGAEAAAALDHLLVTRASALAPGAMAETLWCSDAGTVIGHGHITRASEEEFLLTAYEPSLAWIEDTFKGFAARVYDITDSLARLRLEGSEAANILETAFLGPHVTLKEGRVIQTTVRGLTVSVARLTKTTRPAFALWTDSERAGSLWDRLMRAGQSLPLRPVGQAAVAVAELEAALPRPGTDYASALSADGLTEAVRPEALGLAGLVDFSKPAFVGRAALSQPTGRVPRRLVSLLVEGRPPEIPVMVYAGTRVVGRTTRAAWSPGLGAGLAMAWLEAGVGANGVGLTLSRLDAAGALACRERPRPAPPVEALAGPPTPQP